MRYPNYSVYKDSQAEWLERVPEHWDVPLLKYVARLKYGDSLAASERDESGSILVYGSNGAVGLHSSANTRAPAIIVGRKGSYGKVTFSAEPAFSIDTTYFIDSTCTDHHLRWLYYALQPAGLDTNSQDTGVPGLSREVAYSIRFIAPSYSEQVAIAAFLDQETAQIDTLIAKQERLIALLQEKRQALIAHVVTKGLNPDAPMKNSGIEWLGEVPEHWEVMRLKYLCKIQTGGRDTVNAVEDGLYPFFVRSQTVERINSYSFDCEAVLTAGDGVGVGKVFHYYNGRFDFHQRVYMLNDFRHVLGMFVYYYLKENFYKVALEGNAKSTVDSLRMPLFLNFVVATPTLSEQEAIIAFLDAETTQIDTLIEKTKAAIERLQERRMALISAAVTGKIDVRAYTNGTPL